MSAYLHLKRYNDSSDTELPQVVVAVLVDKHAPITPTHVTKEGVVRPVVFRITSGESLQERVSGRHEFGDSHFDERNLRHD